MNIIARKPYQRTLEFIREESPEIVLIDRGDSDEVHRYVTAVITKHSVTFNEWIHGHYFMDLDKALDDFEARRG